MGQFCEGYDADINRYFNITELLAVFKKQFRQVVAVNLVLESQMLFRASKSNALRLRTLGFANHVAAITSIPAVAHDTISKITESMVGLHMKMSRTNLRKLNAGELQVTMRKFSYRPIPRWSDAIVVHPTIRMMCAVQPCIMLNLTFQKAFGTATRPSLCFFQCPKCGTPKRVDHIKLLKKEALSTVWNNLSCANDLCRRKSSSSGWLCDCKVRWHSCPIHNEPGFRCGLPLHGSPGRSWSQQAPDPPGRTAGPRTCFPHGCA